VSASFRGSGWPEETAALNMLSQVAIFAFENNESGQILSLKSLIFLLKKKFVLG